MKHIIVSLAELMIVVSTGLSAVFLAGCEDAGAAQRTLEQQLRQLQQETTQLTTQLEQAETRNQELREQIQRVSDLKTDAEFEQIYNLQRIKLTGYTNLYDKDKDGKFEKLIVYVQPIDADGDVVKAVGKIDVQLWDLNRPNGQAMIGKWHVGPTELKKNWFTVMIVNYRLVFDISGKIEQYTEPLTVKVTFTDYLTGKVFKEQKIIKPL